MVTIAAFRKTILSHYKKEGRKLPWRETIDPYKILVSEVMLQQTQVPRVVEKYTQFTKQFPDFKSLAKASVADVLIAWQGLGYNRRALFLKKAAENVMLEYDGKLPDDPEKLVALPGIGKATAASIGAFAFNKPTVFIETNVRSVFIHFFFKNRKKVSDDELYPLVEKAVYRENPRMWYNALMDYGVKLKQEHSNPSRKSRHHQTQSKFEGSDRQLRGRIIRLLVAHKQLNETDLINKMDKKDKGRLLQILVRLENEGLVKRTKNKVLLA